MINNKQFTKTYLTKDDLRSKGLHYTIIDTGDPIEEILSYEPYYLNIDENSYCVQIIEVDIDSDRDISCVRLKGFENLLWISGIRIIKFHHSSYLCALPFCFKACSIEYPAYLTDIDNKTIICSKDEPVLYSIYNPIFERYIRKEILNYTFYLYNKVIYSKYIIPSKSLRTPTTIKHSDILHTYASSLDNTMLITVIPLVYEEGFNYYKHF
jgi:hypothetical protein